MPPTPKFRVGVRKKTLTNKIQHGCSNVGYLAAIAIPNQSISVDKSNEQTTRRKLTLDDLIVHSRHYSPNIRKGHSSNSLCSRVEKTSDTASNTDALYGLKELFTLHPDLLHTSTSLVLSSVVRLVADDDANVRKAFNSFIGWYLPRLPSVCSSGL
jgi:pre-rRNA-processing protein IPI1